MEKTLFSTPEVAQWLGVFHTTVRRWIERGEIKGMRVGRNYKIPIEEVIRILETHEIPLPEKLRRYRVKRGKDSNRLSQHTRRSSSILQKLLIVEEIEDPALVCRMDAVLGGNQALADLTGFSQADLIGLDIAELMDEASKEKLIEFARRRMEDPREGPSDYVGYLKTDKMGKKKAKITVGSLNHIKGVFLLIVRVW
jgi:excisionase family DNA binding protein/PAS domain S-box-containing protein